MELALQARRSAVLLDLGLPRLDGYAACRAIRAGGLDRSLIVALTGYGQDRDQHSTAEAGFDAHCMKPVAPDEIRALRPRS